MGDERRRLQIGGGIGGIKREESKVSVRCLRARAFSSRDAIINRHDQLNRNGIRAIACVGSIISRTDVQRAKGISFNARIGVSIIAISFIRLCSSFLFFYFFSFFTLFFFIIGRGAAASAFLDPHPEPRCGRVDTFPTRTAITASFIADEDEDGGFRRKCGSKEFRIRNKVVLVRRTSIFPVDRPEKRENGKERE